MSTDLTRALYEIVAAIDWADFIHVYPDAPWDTLHTKDGETIYWTDGEDVLLVPTPIGLRRKAEAVMCRYEEAHPEPTESPFGRDLLDGYGTLCFVPDEVRQRLGEDG